MSGSKIIQYMLDQRDKTHADLAILKGTKTRQATQAKLKRDSWTLPELSTVAGLLEYDISVTLTDRKNGTKTIIDIPAQKPEQEKQD